MKKLATGFCLCVIAMSSIWAGSFGIEMGWTLEDLDTHGITYEKYDQDYNITIYDVVPVSTHHDFESYYVKIDTEKGIFEISAIGVDISTSVYGTELKSAYEKIRNQVSIAYGTPEEYDYVNYGSIWDEPEDWMMALELGERSLLSFWETDYSNIEVVMLEVDALSDTEGYLHLGYQTYSSILEEILARHDASASSVF